MAGSHASVRRFEPRRDLGPLAELIGVAFGDQLDPTGLAALDEMRRAARWVSFAGWLDVPGWGSGPEGFVWEEDGQVVGNVSLRRAAGGSGFLVGNVVVHPDWRGRGIAGALMEVVLEEAAGRGGRWVGLEVWEENRVARRIYERLGFRVVGEALHMLRPPGLPRQGEAPGRPRLRRARAGDRAALAELLRAVVPDVQRALLELRERDYQPGCGRALDQWLEGRREAWWVVEEEERIRGAVRVLGRNGAYPDLMEVLAAPGWDGRLGPALVRRGIAGLWGGKRRAVAAMLPSPAPSLVAALEAAGFQRSRVQVQMRLELA